VSQTATLSGLVAQPTSAPDTDPEQACLAEGRGCGLITWLATHKNREGKA